MSISCGIIKDLLPLYIDGVCGDESKAAVEEHIGVCETCRAELQAMREQLPINGEAQNIKEAETMINLSKRWKKGMIKSLLKGALFAALTIAALLLVLYLFADIQIIF